MKTGERIYVSGALPTGCNRYVRVASYGTVEDWRPKKKWALITIDYMDGFCGCCELVAKQDIYPLTREEADLNP